MQQYEEVELSALGMAISTIVTVVEILKNNGLVIVKKIYTSTVDIGDEMRGRMVQKPKVWYSAWAWCFQFCKKQELKNDPFYPSI